MKMRRVQLIVGLVLAVGTGALLLGYLTSLRPSGVPGQTRAVLVATHDIPPRAAATSDLFTVQQRLVSQIDSDAISNPKDLAGTYTLIGIPAGGIATRSKIGTASAATLPARLPIGMRAMSISIDDVKGVAGLITPGDRVDVIAVPPRSGDELQHGYTILRGVLVLALGANVQTNTASAPGPLNVTAPGPTTATLAVTPSQADILAGADIGASLRLALRNPKEPIDAFPAESLRVAPGSATASSVAASALAVPAIPIATDPSAQAPAAPSAASGVTVIEGDRVTSAGKPPR
jgi:pilus assembly protein CpaB